jgi:nitrogen fixation protein NifB
MNASDPSVGGMVYDKVQWRGKTYHGAEGAGILLQNQLEGIKKCVDLGMVVKVNIVMIPGINTDHIPKLVKDVKALGVYIVNILPLIPVQGTKFSDRRAPTPEERKKLMDECELDVKMMRHCRQCRADAIGLLGEERSSEFAAMGCQAGCGPSPENSTPILIDEKGPIKMAIATSDGKNVDSGFGNAQRFDVYSVSSNGVKLIRTVTVDTSKQVAGEFHKDHIENTADLLGDCSVIVVKEIGPMPSKVLERRGKTVRISPGPIKREIFKPI